MSKSKIPDHIIHVAKEDDSQRYSLIRFNGNLNVDMGTWANKEVRLRREDNRTSVVTTVAAQDYGAGSEYGSAAREEARRKKYGRQARSYNVDRQPWLLDIKDTANPGAKEKKYKSIVDRTGEHADYWVFVKQGEKFIANKVASWYQFLPQVQHKTLDIDQAEEQFQLRGKVMNQFALKAQIQQQAKDMDEEGEKSVKGSGLIIKDKDIMSSDDEDGNSDADEDQAARKKRLTKKRNNDRPTKDKRVRVQNGDEVAAYESDDGDDEGRECDYMTDSGSESDRETKTNEEKIDEAMVAVGDETGLKRDIDSNEESSEEEEDDDDNEDGKDDAKNDENPNGPNPKDAPGSDDSDVDDLDKTTTSPIFMPQQKQKQNGSEDRKRPHQADSSEQNSSAKKQKMEKSSSSVSMSSKSSSPTPSMPHSASTSSMSERQQDLLLQDQIKRLLLRRPHTTKELLDIIRPQFDKVEKQTLVNKLAAVIRSLEPKQDRRPVGKKEVLHFYLEQKV